MGERLPCKQEVTSSNLVFSIRQLKGVRERKASLWLRRAAVGDTPHSLAAACTLKTAYERKEEISRRRHPRYDVKNINQEKTKTDACHARHV